MREALKCIVVKWMKVPALRNAIYLSRARLICTRISLSRENKRTSILAAAWAAFVVSRFHRTTLDPSHTYTGRRIVIINVRRSGDDCLRSGTRTHTRTKRKKDRRAVGREYNFPFFFSRLSTKVDLLFLCFFYVNARLYRFKSEFSLAFF